MNRRLRLALGGLLACAALIALVLFMLVKLATGFAG